LKKTIGSWHPRSAHQSTIPSQLCSSSLPLHGDVEKAKGDHNRRCDLHDLIESTARPIAETKDVSLRRSLATGLPVILARPKHNDRNEENHMPFEIDEKALRSHQIEIDTTTAVPDISRN
jgi:hypothetical protein|tara:strand:- start:16960 stop:17319 length:360 start_codon:yes stop_codon:yes gene_type:complete